MSLKSYALSTVSRFKTFAKISGTNDDTRIENLINSVTEFIENYIGYRIKETAYTNEEYDTQKGDTLILNNFPIDSAATFTLQRRNSGLNEDDWETVDSEFYHVDYDAGIIYGAGGWRFPRTRRGFRVTYTAGHEYDNTATFLLDTIAGDLELATWMLVSVAFNRGSSGGGIQSESIGHYRVVYAGAMMENEDIKAILDKYKRFDYPGPLTPLNV